MADIIIVSNRLPISVKKVDGELEFFPSIGGLATGLSSYANKGSNKWIGWPGIASEDITRQEKQTIIDELAKSNCYPVFLTRKQLNDFYNVFSNSVLWPLFHNLPLEHVNYTKYWQAYKTVNELFKETVLSLAKPRSNIWIHDYQLLVLPQMLREERPEDKIGFFLHIPFPDPETFSTLRFSKQILQGMLGSDLVGFHTKSYAEHFLEACLSLDTALVSGNGVSQGKRLVQVADFPMGIDYEKYSIAQNTASIRKSAKKLRQQYGRKKIILTVDRLDPTKGLIERLQAYRLLLTSQTKLHGKVVLVMLAVPSRTEIPAYQELRKKLETLVMEINTTFGTRAWKPVDYLYKSLNFEELTALYQIADVAFITPIRDGMNLVAKEYLASKKGKNGVLILSETAGAAEELTEALIVNPTRRPAMVEALYSAVTMPKKELKQRIATMQEHLAVHTVQNWASSFVHQLERSKTLLPNRHLGKLHTRRLVSEYRAAQKRQLFLDYDGVLVPFANLPGEARPSEKLLHVLRDLIADSRNEVIIISGRKQADLEHWLGDLDVILVAEHGMEIRPRNGIWQSYADLTANWKSLLLPILKQYASQTPGAFVEEKEASLVWHYRMSPPYHAQKNIVILKKILRPKLRKSQLSVYSGNKILEIKSRYANKGAAVQNLLGKRTDFILAVGDDYTDEDMFAALPDSAYTIKVGPGRTQAKFRLGSSKAVLQLLRELS